MLRRCVLVLVTAVVVAAPTAAFACGGLIGPRGAVNLTRTTTLAAHHNGIEHYVTAFNYAGGGGAFGSIVPLPGMPWKVEKGGAWTLQRLQRETEPPRAVAAASGGVSNGPAQEVYKTRIDALDITVLRGGGAAVRSWAAAHGFRLPSDAPAVFDFYARRSPYFMAAFFDAKAAQQRDQQIGDGTPIHITIPMRNPWVPLRILSLGKDPREAVDADVYLLTDRVPHLLPLAGNGYTVERQVPASSQLLADLRSDRGMSWMPPSGMTLTHLVVSSSAPQLRYDLATNVHGGRPSRVMAGLAFPVAPTPKPTPKPTPQPTPDPTVQALPAAAPVAPVSDGRPLWPFALAALLMPVGAVGAWFGFRRAGVRR